MVGIGFNISPPSSEKAKERAKQRRIYCEAKNLTQQGPSIARAFPKALGDVVLLCTQGDKFFFNLQN